MAPGDSGDRLLRKVLLVEDDEDTRALVAEHLGRAGYQVETAVDGNDAIASALRVRPDVIVLDLAMPVLDGANTLAILRSYPATMSVPCVICTANAAMLGRRALTYSALVEKPCTPEDVERAVNAVFGEVSDADHG